MTGYANETPVLQQLVKLGEEEWWVESNEGEKTKLTVAILFFYWLAQISFSVYEISQLCSVNGYTNRQRSGET